MDKSGGSSLKAMWQRVRPEQVMALGFALVILLGATLLSLPVASADGQSIGFFSGLFTATSSVCVTGLVVQDTGRDFTLFGQIVILCLIQIGGLGFMAFATMIMVAVGRRITLRDRILLKESMNASGFSGLVRLSLWYGLMAFAIECLGAAVLSIRMIPLFGLGKGIYYSIFHAISAFCNAGFDLLGNYTSLTVLANEPLIYLPISFLIILGGLGFSVLLECIGQRKNPKGLTLHAKIVLTVTGGLLLVGTIFFLLVEWGNPATLGQEGMDFFEKLGHSWFQSVTLRTAGFNTIDQPALSDSSKLMGVLLMFTGAAPASTGGGVKVTTVSVLLLIVLGTLRGKEDTTAFRKKLPSELMRRAVTVLFIAIAALFAGTMIISLAEAGKGYALIDILYEGASALGTVGITAIGTGNLSRISQSVLILMMYFGRVGPVTIALALGRKARKTENLIHYPEESIMLG